MTVTKTSNESYTALTVVSPMKHGEEQKNQDRARWCGPDQVACVADGVTTSPNAALAAELAVSLAPGLFKGDTTERLRMLCDLLLSARHEYRHGTVSFPKHLPASMHPLLAQAVESKMAISHQTTLAALQVRCDQDNVYTRMVRCGDSGVFAFSRENGLLFSSLCSAQSRGLPQDLVGSPFGPGDEILVKVEGCLSQFRALAHRTDLPDPLRRNWLVCKPVEVSSPPRSPGRCPSGPQPLIIRPNDRLLVPKYLWGRSFESQGESFRLLRYASAIKSVWQATADSKEQFGRGGPTTAVLPDHFEHGYCDYTEDRFPRQTHLVLCSDGFYSSFTDARQMWHWLLENHTVLQDDNEQKGSLLEALHQKLDRIIGDDDISFVWVSPKDEPSESHASLRGVSHAG